MINKDQTVTFVTRKLRRRWPDIESLGSPETFPERIRSGIDVWIVRTFLELRSLGDIGFQVSIADTFPVNGAVVAHRDDLILSSGFWRSYVAAVRADRPFVHLAPWQIVQNAESNCVNEVLIPSWPQPGLIRRDVNRHGVTRLGYFGRASSLPHFIRTPEFVEELSRRKIVFQYDEQDWRDYSATDVCVGLRFEPEIGLATKPFAKLTNAWLAGVPALLGPEPAYRSLRRSEFDYLEVRSARDVLQALDRLRNDPALYGHMVENGRIRSREFTCEAVADKWCRFILEQFLPAHREQLNRRFSLRNLSIRVARQYGETRRYKSIEAQQLSALQSNGAGECMND